VQKPDYKGPERRKKKKDPLDLFPPYIVRYIAIAVTALLALGIWGAYRQNDQIRVSAIKNCQNANTVRKVIAGAFNAVITAQIEGIQSEIQLSNSIPPSFFPSIPPDQYQQLLKQSNGERRATINTLQQADKMVAAALGPTDCEALF
jgi:hypothetical protein